MLDVRSDPAPSDAALADRFHLPDAILYLDTATHGPRLRTVQAAAHAAIDAGIAPWRQSDDAWEAARNKGPGYTWSNDNPFAAASLDLDRRIDHVMVGHPKLGGVGHVLAAHVAGDVPIDGMWGSDHLAVVAELRY